MKQELAAIVSERLRLESDDLRREFNQQRSIPTRFFAVDNVFDADVARRIYAAFPPVEEMRLMNSFREHKYTSKALDKLDSIVSDTTFAFQEPEVIEAVAEITGIVDMTGDPQLYAGGISAMTEKQFLNPHLDNSHDAERQRYRVLNLLYYVTPEWKPEYGGNLELWDTNVRERVEIPSLFNRLVVMETHEKSWHSVNPVKFNGKRCCVSNYYFSPHSPNERETFHVTFFQARPEQPLRRLVTTADSHARTLLRKLKKDGLGQKDVYDADKTNT